MVNFDIFKFTKRKTHFPSLLFIHIPKTAGTSFRVACEHYFDQSRCLYDYGINAEQTSALIKSVIYNQHDFFSFSNTFERHYNFLCGHFHVDKYMRLFNTLNVVTFMRNPINHVLSHYRHYCRDLGYTESLEAFIKDKRFKNLQSRMLAAKPIELFGFIGLTEEYEKSIEMINEYYGVSLKVFHENVDVNSVDEIGDDIIELIVKENTKDLELYKRVKNIFYARYEKFLNNETWQHILIQEKSDNFIKGVCMEKNNNNILDIEINFNGMLLSLKADSLRPGLLVHNLNRKGYVGFQYQKRSNK